MDLAENGSRIWPASDTFETDYRSGTQGPFQRRANTREREIDLDNVDRR